MDWSKCFTVLLVEDNQDHAHLVRAYVSASKEAPFQVVHASSVTEALPGLRAGTADIVLLDLTLPDSAGLETYRTVRAYAGQVPIVIMSGIDDEDLAVQAVREGAQDYLRKGDLSREDLLHALRFAIERHRRQTQPATD